jgi:hypothetical protein
LNLKRERKRLTSKTATARAHQHPGRFVFSDQSFFTTAKETLMKLNLIAPKPRNPFVAAAMRRVAGSHRPAKSAVRQQAQRELRQELDRSRHHP